MADPETGRDIHVLHVDDDPQLGDVVARGIESQHDRIAVHTETSPQAGMAALAAESFDCVVSDYDMPRTDGLEFLGDVREEYPDLPFILFTGKGSEEIASDAISAGVTDYLQKGGGLDKYRVLANRIENAVERYRAERERERSQQRYRTLAETVPDAIVTLDPDGKVVFANRASERVFGRSPEELEGEDFTVVFPEADRDEHREQFERYLETGEPARDWTDAEVTIRRPDGEEVPVSVALGEMAFDGQRRITGIVRDISERKRRERRLQQAERKFRKLVEQTVVGIYIIKDGEFEYVNPHVADMMGYDQEEMLDGMSPFDLVVEDDEEILKEKLRKRRRGEIEDAHYRLRGVRKDGEVVVTEVHGSRIELDGEPAIIGAIRDVTERERVREELEAREQTFRSIAETSYDPIFRTDTDGRFTYLSPAVERVTGYEPDELEGRTFRELVVEEDRQEATAAFERVLDGETVEDVTVEIAAKSEDRHTISINATPLEDDGAVVGVQGVARDVTDLERLDERRRSAEARFEQMVERIDDAFFALDTDWRFTHVNERAGELTERDPEELLGDVVWEAFPEAVETTFEAEYRQAMATQEPAEFEEYYPPLETWFEVRAYPDEEGLSVFFRDVTDRKRREQELRDHRDRIQALHDAAVEIAASETGEEVARRIVEAATDVLDHDLCSVGLRDGDRLVTRSVSEGVADDEFYQGTPLDAKDNLAVETYGLGEARLVPDLRETEFAPADSQYRSALSVPIGDHGVFQAVADAPGTFDETDLELAEVLASHAATTLDRIQREQQLRERERDLQRQNDRLETFASAVSHDLRNPLAAAQGGIEIARRTGDEASLDEAQRALDRMESLIDDVLALARDPESVEDATPVSLAAVAREAWGNVSATDAELEIVDDQVLRADRGQLKRLLSNLFANAVEHGADDSPEGNGNGIRIRVGTLEDGQGFYVADDGRGIDAEDPASLFEPGATGDASGTGLGLAIVARIADVHGWDLSVTDSAEGGARFEVGGVER